ncbi:MAG TPA: dihydrolipoyl dehydrogenase [Solirubrobacteraceae bacterium]|nr:dihydrolipoyl dehydrogenase [Solirubrobacteraceae bacterium]
MEPASAGAERDFDVVVLGAGPGGYTAAFRAADLGLRVALVERHEHLGGVCLNVGCIPSKALLHAARVIAQAQEMADHGIRFGAPEVDLERLADWKRSVVSRLTTGLASLARQRGVEVVRGDGALVGPTELVAGGRRLTFSNCIIAAGSRPATIPGLPDDERVIDSTAALSPTSVPKRLLVIGGGIIGMEMACVYDALGARVTVVELLDQLLGGCDPDIVAPLARRARARYEGVITGARVESVAATRDGLEVTIDGAGTSVFDRVLVAVGRTPNGREVGADAAGVAIDERGFIPVDDRMRTNVPGIFAIGDVTGGPMLAHKATHEGVVAAEACAGLDTRMDARTIPSVAYTDPEVAWTGLTETAAAQAGVQYEKAVFPWAASGRALGLARPEGMTKLLLEPGTRRLLGAGIVGVGAGELISEIALAIELGANAQDVALTVHPHPTLSETVAFAAQLAEGTITDLLAPGARGRPAGAAVGRGG